MIIHTHNCMYMCNSLLLQIASKHTFDIKVPLIPYNLRLLQFVQVTLTFAQVIPNFTGDFLVHLQTLMKVGLMEGLLCKVAFLLAGVAKSTQNSYLSISKYNWLNYWGESSAGSTQGPTGALAPTAAPPELTE